MSGDPQIDVRLWLWGGRGTHCVSRNNIMLNSGGDGRTRLGGNWNGGSNGNNQRWGG